MVKICAQNGHEGAVSQFGNAALGGEGLTSDQPIFVQGADGRLTRMERGPYQDEADLQLLVAQNPELLGAGSADDILLIRREQSVADTEAGGGRWSLDHLFVTRDATPVLVEVKRASDTRIRREVVGQMMDYAANGAAYWRIEDLRASFEAQCRDDNIDPVARMAAFLGEEREEESFWEQVAASLKSGRIRMLFVADEIPSELAIIVEFLNEHMTSEVLAVEIRPYHGDNGMRTLVPRVIGNTERARAQKPGSRARLPRIERDEWIRENVKAADVEHFLQVIDLLERIGGEVGVTVSQGSLYVRWMDVTGVYVYPFNLWPDRIYINYSNVKARPGLVDEAARRNFHDRFAAAVGAVNGSNLDGQPHIPLEALYCPEMRATFETVARKFVQKSLHAE